MKSPCPHCLGTGFVQNQVRLGAEMARLRLKAKLTQRAVGKRMGVDHAYVCYLELGKRNWTQERINQFLKAVNSGE